MAVHIKGQWNNWGPWDDWSVSCGTGITTRTRRCDTPAPRNGGRSCDGISQERKKCEEKSCPNDWQIRLMHDETDSSQLLELFVDGQWFRTCADYWSPSKTPAVCRQLLLISEDLQESSSSTDTSVSLHIDCPAFSISDSLSECTHRVVESTCCISGDLSLTCSEESLFVDSRVPLSLSFCEGAYPVNFYHEKVLNAVNGQKLFLNIEFIDTALGDDFLTISSDTHHLISYSGGPAVNVLKLVHEKGRLRIGFVTGSSASHRGIQGYVELVNETKTCEEGYDDLCGIGICVSSEPHSRAGYCYHTDQLSFKVKKMEIAYICDDGQLRLSDDHGGYNSGVLEVKMGNKWHRVCAEMWNQNVTKVACNQLGFHVGFANFSDGRQDGSVYIKSLSCRGEEDKIQECDVYVTTTHSCTNNLVVSLTCGDEDEGNVRLVNGEQNLTGLLQVFFKGNWSYVCGSNFTKTVANVACRQLKQSRAAFVTRNLFIKDTNKGLPLHGSFKCNDGDMFLVSCSYSDSALPCQESDLAGIICEGSTSSNLRESDMRLSNEPEPDGYVEILFNGKWHSVCDNRWNRLAGEVVCRQLGLGVATDVSGISGTKSHGPIILSGVQCNGDETNLFDCKYESIGDAGNKCNRSNDAWVKCLISNQGITFDLRILLALGLISTIIVAICGMMWYRQVLTTRRMQRRPLPPVPPMSIIQGDDHEDIYNEVKDVEHPYYITPIAEEEDETKTLHDDTESLDRPMEAIIEVHHIPQDCEENEKQEKNRDAKQETQAVELADDVHGAIANDKKNERQQDVQDDISLTKIVKSDLQSSPGNNNATDQPPVATAYLNVNEGKDAVTDERKQTEMEKGPSDHKNSPECSRNINDKIKSLQLQDDEAKRQLSGQEPKPCASHIEDTIKSLYSSSIFFDPDNQADENARAADTGNINSQMKKSPNDAVISVKCSPHDDGANEITASQLDDKAEPPTGSPPVSQARCQTDETEECL